MRKVGVVGVGVQAARWPAILAGLVFLLVGAVFSFVGIILLALAVNGLMGAMFLGMGLLFVGIGISSIWASRAVAPRPGAEWIRLTPDDVAHIPPPTSAPWTFDQVVAGLVRGFAETPYAVLRDGDEVQIAPDVADAQWWGLLESHGIRTGYTMLLRRTGEHTLQRIDTSTEVSWQIAVDGRRFPTARLQAQATGGRVWRWDSRQGLGLGPDGRVAPMHFTYSTTEIQTPVRQLMDLAGWRQALDPMTKVGLGVAIVAGGGGALVGIVAAILAATGNL